MVDKPFYKTRYQPPQSIYGLLNKPQRSKSISNGLEREPKLQSARFLERQISVATGLNLPPPIEKQSSVAQLVKQFEAYQSTDNIYEHVFPTLSTSSNKIQTSTINSQKESLEVLSQSTLISRPSEPPISKTKTAKLFRLSSESFSDNPDSLNHEDELIIPPDSQSILTDITNTDSILDPSQHPPLITSEELDKLQSNDKKDDDTSSDKNKMMLVERIKEVHITEETYVKTLYVLSYKLSPIIKETYKKDVNILRTFKYVYKPLLKTIEQLYRFHHDIILPYIRLYQTNDRTDNLWLILQENFQTIENLYKSYYVAYHEYQRELKRLVKSYALKKIHKTMLACKFLLGNLCPITELNCPNQRLLRYILLMKTSIKYLDENSSEYDQTIYIHDKLSRIAIRCEEELVISSFELKRLKQRFDNKSEYFEKQRLLWHGSLKKLSPKKRNDITQLYIILLSECILVCEESGQKLEIKRPLSLSNLTIDILENRQLLSSNGQQQSNAIVYYPFRVNAIEKSYEFIVEKESDREKWVKKILQAHEDFQNQKTIPDIAKSQPLTNKTSIGLRAPIFVYDSDVTRCQICHNRFGLKLTPSSRHHCRACGRSICGSCSTKKLMLRYRLKDGELRVCDQCYTLATGIHLKHSISTVKLTRHPNQTILFGNFRCPSSNSIVWIELQEDYHLHIYNGKLDQIEDYSINLIDMREILFNDQIRLFILNNKDKRYKFSMELNHQLLIQKNEIIEEELKSTNNKLLFYAKLWYDAMQLARLKTLPSWYIKKRDSADSGISAVE